MIKNELLAIKPSHGSFKRVKTQQVHLLRKNT